MAAESKMSKPAESKPAPRMALPWCEHGRSAQHCEDCRHFALAERRRHLPKDDRRAVENVAGSTTAEHVDTDTYINRVDLAGDGPMPRTLLRAGDAVPPALADLPREAVPEHERPPRPRDTPPDHPGTIVL